jgi:Ala-tRNA(Pro) deacylase
MPPFGNLYGMAVFADESLSRDREITFSAGTGRQLVRMNESDFRDLVRPVLLPLVFGESESARGVNLP